MYRPARIDDRTTDELHCAADDGEAGLLADGYGRCCCYCGVWFEPGERIVQSLDGGDIHPSCSDEEFAETHQMEEAA